jgi:transposase
MQQRTQPTFDDQPIFVGLDVHKRHWHVSIRTADIHHKTFSQPPHVEPLVAYLQRLFPGAQYTCVYEAGFCGFSVAHGLAERGIECLVIHPPDLPRSERDRIYKSDPVDARRLARELAAGHLQSIYIPERTALEDRALVRMRQGFVHKQTRCKTQIRHQLSFYGIVVPETIAGTYWSRNFLAWLHALTLTTPSGTVAFQALVTELEHLRIQVGALTQHIRRRAREAPYAEAVHLLCTIPGIGALTAMTVLTEIVDIGRFRTAEALASYAGLVPGVHASGDQERQTGLHKRRNAVLRHALIESAWSAVQYDPVLLAWFTQACMRRAKSQAIVGVARRLLNRIRYVLQTRQPYQVRAPQTSNA